MRNAHAALLIAIAGCGAGKANSAPDAAVINSDAAGTPDAPPSCTTFVDFQPAHPVAGPQSIVVANGHAVSATTFTTFTWQVKFNGNVVATTPLGQFGDAISFAVPDAGLYEVHFQAGSPLDCAVTDTTLNVTVPGANTQAWRLRVIPPPGASASAPAQERIVTITGGADNAYGLVTLDPGLDAPGTITDGGGAPVAAYARFEPEASPDVPVETFSSASGAFDVRVQAGKHDVLIVPASASLAPVRILGWQAGGALVVPAADTIAGTVIAPDGSPLAGARVALAIAGVPTTIAITDAGGAWSVLGHVGGAVDVTVVPPDASGLPRLTATATTIDPTLAITVRYASAVATIDLGGTLIRSAGAAAPGARVTFTGSIASAGTITAGAKNVAATGVVATVAHADGSGTLLATLVVRGALVAVIEPSPAVAAVVAVDTTGTKPAAIDAPAQVAITGTVTDPTGAPRASARVRLAPTGALAAGTLLVPGATTGADGKFSILGASGGHYALAAVDLAQSYSELDVADVTGGAAGTLHLGPAIALTGGVMVTGSANPVDGAALTLLCATCTGVDRSRAAAEGVTAGGGTFRLAVPDPGVALR